MKTAGGVTEPAVGLGLPLMTPIWAVHRAATVSDDTCRHIAVSTRHSAGARGSVHINESRLSSEARDERIVGASAA